MNSRFLRIPESKAGVDSTSQLRLTSSFHIHACIPAHACEHTHTHTYLHMHTTTMCLTFSLEQYGVFGAFKKESSDIFVFFNYSSGCHMENELEEKRWRHS